MSLQIHPFSILLICVALFGNALIQFTSFQRKKSHALIASLLMISLTLWMVSSAIELASTSYAAKIFWSRVQFVGFSTATLILLILSLAYTNQKNWMTPRKLLLISVPSFLSLLLVFTDNLHGLVFSRISINQLGPYVTSEVHVNIGFWIIIGYYLLIDLIAIFVLFHSYFRNTHRARGDIGLLMMTLVLPQIVYIFVDRLGISSRLGYHLAPMVFGISIPIATLLLDRMYNQLYGVDLLPFAQNTIPENIADVVIVVNTEKQIVYANKAAKMLFAASGEQLIGTTLETIGVTIDGDNIQNKLNDQTELHLAIDKEKRHYIFRVIPFYDSKECIEAQLILLNDVTDVKGLTLENRSMVETVQTISSNVDLNDVLTQIAKQITSALNADGCTLSFWDKEQNAVVTWFEYRQLNNETRDMPGDTYLLADYPATNAVLKRRQAIAINASDTDADPKEISLMKKTGVKSMLMLPLIVEDTVIGLVEIDQTTKERQFSDSDIRLALTLSDQAAIAIHNKQLLIETKQRLYEQTVLREAGSAISSTLDLNVVLSQIVAQMCTAVKATSAYICSYDAETAVSWVIAEFISDEAHGAEKESDIGVQYDELEPDFIDLLNLGRHDFSHIDDEDISDSEREHMQKFGARSILYIPLRVKDQTIGFVEIWDSRQRREFSSEEISLCQSISQQAAIALDNARLFDTAQKELEERKRIEGRLYFDATHDELTGLPNRRFFLEKLGQVCQQPTRDQTRSFAVLFLDFDRFKVVNDSLGHPSGDQLLIESTRRIQACLRSTDLLSRLGGDEFAILIENVSNPKYATQIADRILGKITQPFIIKDREIYISTSIGIIFEQARNQNPDEIIRDADIAMYIAKENGGDRYAIFTPDMRSKAITRLETESALRQAISAGDLALYYQPIFSLQTDQLLGFEALVRWIDPDHGIVVPQKFLPLAEETGLIVQIDQWVLREACHQLVSWNNGSSLDQPPYISVNLSGQRLFQPHLPVDVQSVLLECGLPAEQLILEISESAIMKHAESTVEMLTRLRQIGVKLHIDDFGTGYSSLSYLHRFPFDAIKIDRSFINSIQNFETSSGLVPTIIKLAHTLNMSVVAEGVETIKQKSYLKNLKCEAGQGFYYGKPMDKSSIENHYLQKHIKQEQLLSSEMDRMS